MGDTLQRVPKSRVAGTQRTLSEHTTRAALLARLLRAMIEPAAAQVCAAKGTLPGQGSDNIIFSFAPKDLQ
eukprot:4398873-Prymnesium_polylepis.1